MKKAKGKKLKLSFSRRCMVDFLHFSQKVSSHSVSAERFMELSSVISARQNCPIKISWYSIFMKAFAKVSKDFPELRQVFLPFVFPKIYQFTNTSGSIAIEREYNNEAMVIYLKLDSPELMPLQELDRRIKNAKDCPIQSEPSFRRFLKINKFPFLIRRILWWFGLNIASSRRNYFGTFGLTGIGKGVRSLSLKSPLSVNLVFDMTQPTHKPLVRLFWDHRVFDGVVVINILEKLESYLNQDLAVEIKSLTADQQMDENLCQKELL